MAHRSIPIVSFDGFSQIPCRELRAAGWALHLLSAASEAVSSIGKNKFFAGLMLFSEAAESSLQSVEEILLADPLVKWLALVTPTHLCSPSISCFLIENFHDFHTHPVDTHRLLATLGHAYGLCSLERQLRSGEHNVAAGSLIGTSPVMHQLQRDMVKMQKDDAPILITGESGTGKELVAQAIHSGSPRRDSPFVAVNCGAIPASLIQSELFGHEKGAFTDAFQRKIGRFEYAVGGTIFLDEIGDLPLSSQVNLLRFLQEKSIERVGSGVPLQVDVRVVAATNVDLEDAITKGRFREDLFYRLNVLRLRLPPLRDRGGDIELLTQSFMEKYSRECGKKTKRLSIQAVQAMYDHCWPGNVRELINRIRRAVVLSEGRLITPADLGLDCEETAELVTLDRARDMAELAAVRASLQRNKNNISMAARQLGVSRYTLYRLIHKFEITALPPGARPAV